ncbi:MAG: ATP-dependent helicase RhlE [Fimbriimonadaceae bacterium]|nr:ATP-dependent helicase RhlE [Fimbriimonadaceae bacterium]
MVLEQTLSAGAFFMSETKTMEGFRALDLSPSVLQKIDRLGFTVPTPIQQQAIPVALTGRDLVGIAQTGTGKTLAFGLPMAQRMLPGQVGLILAPTRELALQIQETFQKLNIKSALLIGGEPIHRQFKQLRANPSVLVATPGRLEDHLHQRSLDLRRVTIVVLDEADRMLDMGFAPAIRRILDQTPKERQTMLFSATMPREITDLANQYLRNPLRIEVAKSGTAAENVEHELVVLPHGDKPACLGDLLKEHNGTVLVFARTRHGARKLAKTVRGFGHSAAELHSDRTMEQRRAALKGFKTGTYRVLVATDIAARGIDVKDIGLVVNFDVPEKAEDYVHRIGRTGRAGASGRAITFATPEQQNDVRDIEKLLKSELPISARSTERFYGKGPKVRVQGSGGARGGSWGPVRTRRPMR